MQAEYLHYNFIHYLKKKEKKTFLPCEDQGRIIICLGFEDQKMLINYIPVIQNPLHSSKTVKSYLNSILLLTWESRQPAAWKGTVTVYVWRSIHWLKKNCSTWGSFYSLSLSVDKRSEKRNEEQDTAPVSDSQRSWVKSRLQQETISPNSCRERSKFAAD